MIWGKSSWPTKLYGGADGHAATHTLIYHSWDTKKKLRVVSFGKNWGQ